MLVSHLLHSRNAAFLERALRCVQCATAEPETIGEVHFRETRKEIMGAVTTFVGTCKTRWKPVAPWHRCLTSPTLEHVGILHYLSDTTPAVVACPSACIPKVAAIRRHMSALAKIPFWLGSSIERPFPWHHHMVASSRRSCAKLWNPRSGGWGRTIHCLTDIKSLSTTLRQVHETPFINKILFYGCSFHFPGCYVFLKQSLKKL